MNSELKIEIASIFNKFNRLKFILFSNKIIFIFAKKTCKSCLALSPILERLNQAFHKHLEFPIPVGRVQCDEQTFFCTRIHEVTHYPTLRLYTNHKEHFAQYKGPIDFPRIARWVNDRVFNSLIRITTDKHIQNIKK